MTKEQHTAFGLHSNIPQCCIDFFLADWDREVMLESPYYYAVHMANFKYVPCPECLVGRKKVEIKDCDKECGKKCYLEYQVPMPEEKPLTKIVTWDIL